MKTLELALFAIQSLSCLALLSHTLLQLCLTWSSVRHLRAEEPTTGRDATGSLPCVTVQLPVYNEKYVVERLIDRVTDLCYPRDRFEIQVLDDSTDETMALVAAKVREYQSQGFQIQHVRRQTRDGFKAGALNHGLELATGELVAIFDADFAPDPEFLLSSVRYFDKPGVGMVQTRCAFANREHSILTRVQAFILDAHFMVEQAGRSQLGCFINFNGTAGIWRAEAIRDAGNWSHETLAEDLDLSYRAQLRGWELVYVDDVLSEGELPVDIRSFRSQQFRWMNGTARNAVRLMPRVLLSKLGSRVKVHACYQLLQSCLYLPVLALILLTPMFLVMERRELGLAWSLLGAAFMASGLGLGVVYFVPQRKRLPGVRGVLTFLKLWLGFWIVTMGLSVHNSVAVIHGLLGRSREFVRTPKGNPPAGRVHASHNVYLLTGFDRLAALEVIVWLYLAVALSRGTFRGTLDMLLPAAAFVGLSFVLAKSVQYAIMPLMTARRMRSAVALEYSRPRPQSTEGSKRK